MNVGLFALMAGFLLPVALVVRLMGMLAMELWRGLGHPLNIVLATELVLASVPVVALTPTVWHVVGGKSVEAGAILLDYTATDWGLVKLAVNLIGVLLADIAMPRVYDQLTRAPGSLVLPTRSYLLRDLGVLATCVLLALAVAVHR